MEIFFSFIFVLNFVVVGDNKNRRVVFSKIVNNDSRILADLRRADIFLPNDVLTALIRISKCM